jgi:hypothetical protein
MNHIKEWAMAYIIGSFIIITFVALYFYPASDTIKGRDVSGADGKGEVKLVVLEDGTKCAVLIGYNKGAITCNWK